MNTYFISGSCPAGLRDSVITSDSFITYHGDGRFSSEITAPTLRAALSYLSRLIGDCEYTLNIRYAVVNSLGKCSSRLVSSKYIGGAK